MASDIKEAIRRLIYQYVVEGADKVMATQEAVAASTTKTDKASLSLEKAFGSLERRYVETVRYQQDYQKVQEKVNAAVAQNPQLQERANAVLAAAGEHFQNLASRGNFFSEIVVKGFTKFLGPMALFNLALTAIGTAIGYMAAQWQGSSRTIEEATTETNRLLAETKKLIDANTSAQERMFAQGKDVTKLQVQQNENKLLAEYNQLMLDAIALAERKLTLPTQVAGEMGEAPGGAVAVPGMEKAVEVLDRLKAAHAANLPGLVAFNNEMAKIALQHPEIAAALNDMIAKTQQSALAKERDLVITRAMNAALNDMAVNAQAAALGLGSVAQIQFNAQKIQESADATERLAQEAARLRELYPGITNDTAKQLEILDAQLKVAQARTREEELIAQQYLRQVQLIAQGKKEEEAILLAAKERRVAEENFTKQQEKQAPAQRSVADAASDTTDELNDAGDAIVNNVAQTNNWARAVNGVAREISFFDKSFTLAAGVEGRLSELTPQSAGKQYTMSYDPFYIQWRKTSGLRIPLEGGASGASGDPYGDKQFFADQQKKMTDAMNGLTDSTDALNATMQNILSPYYSQDPRTTKLGFRAGVMGNTDWLAPGATNANPLAVILGAGATAPGMADGGSFVVGGGYSANDNKVAAFPVASGEQVVVNRNRKDGGGNVVNIDNRIIINGAVDADAMSQLKVSRYQQAQRMRAGLSRAS